LFVTLRFPVTVPHPPIPVLRPSIDISSVRKQSSLAIPTPYAFNYHLDPAGQFRGLAFANFRVAADADAVVAALNGFDVQGRKLRVEYKKVLQAGEKERIEREKAIRRMRSMQLEKERQEQQQQQQLMMGGGGPLGPAGYDEYSPLSGPPGGGRGSPFVMGIQNANPFAVPPMPVPQPYAHQAQSAPSPVQMQAPPPMPTHQQQQQQTAASVQKSSSAQTELDMNDAATLEIYSRILLFKDDHMRDELAFARSLPPKQRRIVHLVAQKLGVYHYSVGEGDERYAVVTRNQPDRSGGNSTGGVGPTENGRRTPSAVENNNGHGRPEGRSGPVRHHSSQALNRSFLVSSTSANGGGSMFTTSTSYNQPSNGSPTSTSPGGGLRAKKSMPDMKTSIYTPTPRLTTRTSSGNMREGGSTFSSYAALRRQTSGIIPGLGQIFGAHLTGGSGLARASVSGAIGDRPLAGLNGHPTEGIPPVPSLPSTPEGGPSSATSAAVMRQPRGPGAASGGNFARRRESAVGPLDRMGSGNSGLDARTHEPLEI
jgi:RNA recognition motif-containing protein